MKRKLRRPTAWALLLVMCAEVGRPMAFALSSGPTQPEVQGFQPVTADKMVDLFSGDMSYNIPLMDVEGYPLNLFYSGGTGMDQEASWVGLGWNLNVGTVDRSLRGVPDDFNGEIIERRLNVRPNRSFGLGYGVGVQLFGLDMLGLNINISPSFNNYYGPAFDTGLSLSLQASAGSNCGFNAGLGLNSSSNRGLSLQPRVGFDVSQSKGAVKATAGLNFGLNIDSRQGLTNYSIGLTASASHTKEIKSTTANGQTTHAYGGNRKSAGSLGSKSVNASFDIGHPTYTPQISMPMENYSLSVAFTLGAEVYGSHPNMSLSGFYSEQRLRSTSNNAPAYGYMYLDQGQLNDRAMLDMNREKDGPYSGDRAGLPLAALTNDVFSASGQGVSGSYRPYRSEVGHVFDGSNSSNGVGADLSGEVGAGNAVHVGANVVVNSSNSSSGVWASANMARSVLRYRSNVTDPLHERVFFREANEATVEQDPNIWTAMQGASPMRFTLPSAGQYDHALGPKLTQGGATYPLPGTNYRTKREPRGQLFSYLTHKEMFNKLGLDLVAPHMGGFTPADHHMSEVSITNTEGMRYVYGIPAYNKTQKDVEFNVEGTPAANGSVSYTGTENSTGNTAGRDYSYSCSTTPPYAYAFLLTAQLSPDYSDVDGTFGPSEGDLGTYTKFNYKQKHTNFPWRTPAWNAAGKGRFSEGLKGTPLDDQTSYVYGEKEIWYLNVIETRNYVAVFNTSDRGDALGVTESGANSGDRLSRLDAIVLYERSDYEANGTSAVPLKTVHFTYDYSLCQGTPNSAAGGKLTLKKIWFTYGRSELGFAAPYKFEYGDNPRYDMLAQDRWGSVKPDVESGTYWSQFAGQTDAQHTRNADYPYAIQNPVIAKQLAGAWCLTKIILPTGGKIEVNYEADDYAYVQNRQAMRMYKIIATTDGTANLSDSEELHFKIPAYALPPGSLSNAAYRNALRAALIAQIDINNPMYFRFKVDINADAPENYDYISGYCQIDQLAVEDDGGGNALCKLKLEQVSIDEGSGPSKNPILRAAVEFFQVNYSHLIHSWDGQDEWTDSDASNPTADFFYAMITSVSGLVTGIGDFFNGPNEATWNDHHGPRFERFALNESYVRLNVPNHRKLGGGHRVSSVRLVDNWHSLQMETAETDKEFTYGTNYQYGDVNGSWGVASFEPLTGADENPFRKPIYTSVSKALSPDDRFYQEEPFGETFFPSAQVGYSKVVVTDYFPSIQAQATQGTGKSVHEFYTAKDFPTITARTGIDPQRRKNSFNPLALLGFDVIDHMHATQGYSIETNDMHGKPKLTSVYPEGSDQAISTEEYTYASAAMGDARRLVNTLKTIDANGQVADKDIGLQYEFVADMREFVNKNTSGGAQVNVETFLILAVPVPIPIILPTYSSSSTRYKTGVLVKKVHRFGQLTKVTRMSNGSEVTTENLAYDAVTGGVLLTKVQNGFEDPVYSMSFPAYWHYDGMGPAYANMGVRFASLTFGAGWATVTDAAKYFSEGDELAVWPAGGFPTRGWVQDVQPGSIHVVDRNGNDVAMTGAVKVLRSGRRNMQSQNMMDLTLQSDPLATLASNAYSDVLDSKVKVYGNVWRTECACEGQGEDALNDYLVGRKGQWRLHKEMVWLTERTRSNFDDNTNIRRDGVYTAFAPYYQLQTGDWNIVEAGWTAAREVTLYNRRGTELENRDALGLYSAASFGFDGSLPTAVAKNARYAEILSDNFEEGMIGDCTTRRWEITAPLGVTNTAAHTGRYSVRASDASPVVVSMDLWSCPPPGCDLDLYIAPGGSGQVIASLGAPPYSFSYELLANTDPVSLLPVAPNEVQIVSYGTMYIIRVTVEDANGCKATRIWSDIQ